MGRKSQYQNNFRTFAKLMGQVTSNPVDKINFMESKSLSSEKWVIISTHRVDWNWQKIA